MTDVVDETDGNLLDDDPVTVLQAEIAERLSALSDVADTPIGFARSGGWFDASEVDFATGSWMSRLAEVQEWLRLDIELPTRADEFVERLVAALELLDPSKSIDTSGPHPQLTVSGLSQLYERIDQAARLQQVFVEKYEEEAGTRAAATKAWNDAWDDEPESAASEPLKPVSATASTWRISDFTGKKLNLTPSYQRGDVWGATSRQMLIESILRGIPLPSVILLRPEDPSQPHEVVDGKQRLTAILRFVGKHPLAIDRVEKADKYHGQEGALVKAFSEDYPTFKRLWKSLEHQQVTSKVEDEYFFPFRLRNNDEGLNGPLEPLQGKYYTQITDRVINAADEDVLIEELFAGTPEYRIPVIVYKRASQGQIHEVFNLYNKQGMHLNAEEIRNAIFHELELTRATLVAAGDSDTRTDPREIAPALAPIWSEIQHLGLTLRDYGFGSSRYRRTKVLAWVIATLLGDTSGKDLPSTSRHIDDLLKRAKDQDADPLNKPATVADLFSWVSKTAKIHASYDDELWAPKFKDGAAGQKWQELQLVGSLVGVAIAQAGDPDGIENRVEAAADAIFSASATAELGEDHSVWARPGKTQTRTQWAFIAGVAKAIVDLLEVDVAVASNSIRRRFGSSGVESLFAVLPHDSK
ncbi:DUF262 domain-containing protein [Microbacterium sp. STN6]|uniref:DUF262 domain-containing protein n=1 Tax=Microbacterium sp. STN6 TaxID=2995588 RepID=UPI002260F9B3|nr:DUF262 domain-containing protein [Microbacterium sp. STN6]MCX7522591.1 DUF262 domain-containing protein [Microbacterium sp. STN6]